MIDCVSSVKPFASFLQHTFQILHHLEELQCIQHYLQILLYFFDYYNTEGYSDLFQYIRKLQEEVKAIG